MDGGDGGDVASAQDRGARKVVVDTKMCAIHHRGMQMKVKETTDQHTLVRWMPWRLQLGRLLDRAAVPLNL